MEGWAIWAFCVILINSLSMTRLVKKQRWVTKDMRLYSSAIRCDVWCISSRIQSDSRTWRYTGKWSYLATRTTKDVASLKILSIPPTILPDFLLPLIVKPRGWHSIYHLFLVFLFSFIPYHNNLSCPLSFCTLAISLSWPNSRSD